MTITVIVIDDDIDTLEVFSEFLEIKDIKVLGRGHDGRKAAELYEKYRPDIVIMDAMMPDFDGFYGITKIREINPDAKIIMVTATVSDETEKKLNDSNVSAVVKKPYKIEELINLIDNLKNGQIAVVSKNK